MPVPLLLLLGHPLCVPLPPFLGAIRSSSFTRRKRFFGAGVSAGGDCSGGVRSSFGSMVRLLETGLRTVAASTKQRSRCGGSAACRRGRSNDSAHEGGTDDGW